MPHALQTAAFREGNKDRVPPIVVRRHPFPLFDAGHLGCHDLCGAEELLHLRTLRHHAARDLKVLHAVPANQDGLPSVSGDELAVENVAGLLRDTPEECIAASVKFFALAFEWTMRCIKNSIVDGSNRHYFATFFGLSRFGNNSPWLCCAIATVRAQKLWMPKNCAAENVAC